MVGTSSRQHYNVRQKNYKIQRPETVSNSDVRKHQTRMQRLEKRNRRKYIEDTYSSFIPHENRQIPNFSVIPETCLGGQVHKGEDLDALRQELTKDYYMFKSDHALIRVEFKDFVIYSWNLLDGDDVTITPYTFGKLNYPKSETFPDGFFPGKTVYNDDAKNFAEHFKDTNAARTQNLLDIVDRVKQNEGKPVILFFQEVGPTMLDVIQNHYINNYHIFHDKDEIEVAWEPFSKQAVQKNEYRVTLIPKTIEIKDKHSISMSHNEPGKLVYTKPQLLISFVINGKEFCLINCHWYWLSLFKDVTNFLEQVELYLEEQKIKNVIFVGDFNRPFHSIKKSDVTEEIEAEIRNIQEKLQHIQLQQQKIKQIQLIPPFSELKEYRFEFLQDRIVKYLTEKKYNILNEENPSIYTFITNSLGGSDRVDQCIYRIEKQDDEEPEEPVITYDGNGNAYVDGKLDHALTLSRFYG